MELYTYVHMYVATFVIHRKTANRHFLKSMARVGAGCDEFFDPKTKSKWQRKVMTFIEIYVARIFTFLHTVYVQTADYPINCAHLTLV